MTPGELRNANVMRFRLMLERMTDPGARLQIERLLEEERLKPDSAYPGPSSESADPFAFSCLTYDDLSAAPALSRIVADGEARARKLVRDHLLNTPHSVRVEVFRGGKLLWTETN